MPRPLEFDREWALERAAGIFLEKGYEAASVEDLTSGLGISRASLYNSFGDKHGLLIAVLEAAEGRGLEMRARICGGASCAKEAVREFLETLLMGDSKAAGQGCLMLTLGAELASSDPEVRERVRASLDASREMFAKILKAERRFTAAAVREKSACLVGAMTALMTLRRIHPGKDLLEANLNQALRILD
jgi:TetR/AcrR family transcriptional regulator, transcriptional repressor for nem operon